MKRNFILSALLLVAGFLFAQQPVITFTVTEHNFGKINEADGRVSTVFEFKNEGMTPLVLSNVRASCGCTTPTWTKTPVEPGQTGAITVTYNPNGRPGKFQKTITVTSNATEGTKKLYIKGEVIPKAAKPVNKYPEKIDDLSLAVRSVNFGTVLKGKNLTRTIEYANLTDQDITVDILRADTDPLVAQASLTTIKKGESGQFNINFDAAAGKMYGPQEYNLLVVVNGKKIDDEKHYIHATVNVEEDFSTLTVEQKQQAPILELGATTIDLGVVTPGKAAKKTISINNAGTNPMYIRRIINMNETIMKVSAAKTTLKGGKKSTIAVEVNGKNGNENLKPGDYHRTFTIMTNDPQKPKMQVTVNWTVK